MELKPLFVGASIEYQDIKNKKKSYRVVDGVQLQGLKSPYQIIHESLRYFITKLSHRDACGIILYELFPKK